MSKKITEEMVDRICAMYSGGKSVKEIALETGVSGPACLYKLKSRKVTMRPRPRKYAVDETFFDVIDTEEKAYWLGFISADGCVTRGNLKITLATKDKIHLEKFRRSIKSTTPIVSTTTTLKNGKTYSGNYLSISSSKIFLALCDKFITPNKSLTLKPYKVREDLKRHYWRGFIDGDGCIQYNPGKKTYSLELMGTLDVVKEFREWVQSHCDVHQAIAKMRNVYIQRVNSKPVICKILNLLYVNCNFYLDRKKDKAESILKL